MKPRLAGARLRSRADDGEVDRNHRQHARREIQREAAKKHDQQNRERSAAFEEPALFDAGLGVVQLFEEVVAASITSKRSQNRKAVEFR